MVHVGKRRLGAGFHAAPRDLIDPALTVARRANDPQGENLRYWPSYAEIPPGSRASYLDWLAAGAADPFIGIGYVFLYFYGIERRFFSGAMPPEEAPALIAEVERLLDLYGENRSVRRYLGAFLEAAALLSPTLADPRPSFEREGWEIPLPVRLAIGRRLKAGETLDAAWALSWLMSHPEARLRMPAQRAAPEFAALFAARFGARHPGGMKVRTPKRKLSASYQAASGEFTIDLTERIGDVTDISTSRAPVDALQKIADEACEDLTKFSRFLGRNPEGRGTVEAHALLPEEIRHAFPCPELDALRDWAEGVIAEGGLIPVEDLVARLEGAKPEKLGKKRLEGVADALAALGIGFAPDPRNALRAPKIGEPAVLFRLPEPDTRLEAVGAPYRAALLGAVIGAHVAHADGEVSEDERRALTARIDAAKGVSGNERAMLHGNLAWALAAPPAAALFRRHLKELPEDARLALARLSAATAASDGTLDPAEMKALEKIYKALELDLALMHGHVHEMMSGAAPVTLRAPGTDGADYAIPPPPEAGPETAPAAEATPAVALDRARIDAVMADTARVAGVLHGIFSDEEEDGDGPEAPEEEQDASAPAADRRFDGLDPAHARLADRLLGTPRWSEEAFEAVAEDCGLMPAGALETLNEWAWTTHDDALLEEDDGYDVNPEIAARIAAAA